MAYKTESAQVREMFGAIAPRYDVTNTVLSLGIHHLWKQHFINSLPVKPGMKVLDLACGTGDLVPLLAKRCGPDVTGGDFCEPMLEVARERFPQFSFVQCDALNMQFPDNSFDLVTISFGVRNFEDLKKGLIEIRRILKPGGTIAVLEFGQPDGIVFGPLYRVYSKYLMPLIGGLLTGNRDAYAYLPQTAARFPSAESFLTILKETGFSEPALHRYTFGIAYGYSAIHKG